MQDRYKNCFEKIKKEGRIAFIPFWMIGDPNPEESLNIIKLIARKSDILELGMPFSDPLADGQVIQDAVNRALENNITTQKCFDIIKKIRDKFPEKPIGLLVYFNLILSFGIEEYFEMCQHSGVDSVLIPELPVEEINFQIGADKNNLKSIQETAQKYNISLVFLVSTNTPENRLEKVLNASKGGFIYAVSTPSITGAKTDISPQTFKMITALKEKTETPIAVGFGISSPEHIQNLKKYKADGAIIGSKLIDIYQKNGVSALEEFLEKCQSAT